jgi:plastocyanin
MTSPGYCRPMRGFVAVAVTVGVLAAAPAALAVDNFNYSNAQTYVWQGTTGNGTNHGAVAPQAIFKFHATDASVLDDHPIVWDTGDLPPGTGTTADKQYNAPTQPGFYAFHCSIHGTAGTEGSVGGGMAGFLVVGTDGHATPDFSTSSPANAGSQVTFTYTGTGDPDAGDQITRYLWDLDGDGSFETSTTSPSAAKTYPNPGSVNVSLKVIDKGHEFSNVATHAVNVQAAGPGGSPAIDRIAPTIAFGKKVTKVRKGKLKVKFTSNEAGSASATLKRGKKKLGSGRAKLVVPGPHVLVVKLNRAARRALHRRGNLRTRLTLTVKDAAGNPATAKRTLTVREAA